MNKVDQIKVINDMINEARTNLKPLSFNLVFWGIFINIMSIIHYTFPSFIQQTNYSAGIYWIFLPMIGMIYMTRWNIKKYKEMGYSTTLGRVIKIVWAVFGIGWLMISGLAFYLAQKFAPDRIQAMKLYYEDEFQRALSEDGSSTSVHITPKTYYPGT